MTFSQPLGFGSTEYRLQNMGAIDAIWSRRSARTDDLLITNP